MSLQDLNACFLNAQSECDSLLSHVDGGVSSQFMEAYSAKVEHDPSFCSYKKAKWLGNSGVVEFTTDRTNKRIFFPAVGFLIASRLVPYYQELLKYRQCVIEILDDNGTNLDEQEDSKGNVSSTALAYVDASHRVSADEKVWLKKFLSETKNTPNQWWGKGKEIKRTNDFFVSPLMKAARLNAETQNEIAEVAKQLSENPDLLALIVAGSASTNGQSEAPMTNVDRLSMALKLFAEKRKEEEWCSDKTDGDTNKPRIGLVANKMRRGASVAAPVVSQLQHGTVAQIRAWFKRTVAPESQKCVVDSVDNGDLITFGPYLAHLIQPQTPAPARPAKFTRALESIARSMIAPDKFGVYDEPVHKALSSLGLIDFPFNTDFTDLDYDDVLHAQRVILRRLVEMKTPQVMEFGKAYSPSDPDWKDADYLTVYEFLWFVLQEDNLKDINKKVMEMSLETPDLSKKTPGDKDWKDVISDKPDDMMSRLVAALLTKPFAILAGASGTGKSRMVRKLAYMTCLNTQLQPNPATKKSIENFRMVQVKPNWHDSTDLLGYRSAVSGTDKYVSTDFVRFILKAHAFPTTPFFVCLDEMNLAPVEHYFAEFLSAMESGRVENGEYITDPVISPGEFKGDVANLDPQGYSIPNERKALIESHGLYIPKNLFVVGTVNMDDSTRGFSRKVLDRAMTIVMDKVDFTDLQHPADLILVDKKDGAGNVVAKGLLLNETQIGKFIERVPFDPAKFDDPFRDQLETFRKSLENTALAFAFRFALECTQYREAMKVLYDGANPAITEYDQIALDHLTLMKLLPRLEGNMDERTKIIGALKDFFQTIGSHDLSAKELTRMTDAARTNGGYLSFWP